MHRRTLIAAALMLVMAPSLARADMAPSPPPPLAIEAAPLVHTARTGGPTEATFVLRNTGAAPLQVRVESLVALLPQMRLPLRIVGASPGREVTVPAHGRVDLRVTFEPMSGPAAREHEWTIELRAEVNGAGAHYGRFASGTTTVRWVPVPG